MPEPIALISSCEFEQEELINFLQTIGAVIINDPRDSYNARLSKGNLHVWIALKNSGLNELEADEIELITQKLIGRPRTYILLDISREVGSQQLAIEFACAFAERWPCVVNDLEDKIFSSQELFDLRRNGRGFEE